jgi:anaphase-promoting complex subunit 10
MSSPTFSSSSLANGPKDLIFVDTLSHETIGEDRELGVEAVFTISSAKPGNGVEQLRDDNLETYWQSDGTFPHLINIQFLKKVSVTKFCLYVDHSIDESYTPKKISINVGTCAHDLIEVMATELNEPTGWVVIDLSTKGSGSDDLLLNPFSTVPTSSCIRAHFLQLKVSSMHQNGKDTHIRQIKVYGKRESQRVMADLYHDDFKTKEMAQFCVIR